MPSNVAAVVNGETSFTNVIAEIRSNVVQNGFSPSNSIHNKTRFPIMEYPKSLIEYRPNASSTIDLCPTKIIGNKCSANKNSYGSKNEDYVT